MLKKEQYEILEKFKVQLYNALYLDFIRLSSIKDKELLSKIYKEIFNKDSEIMNGCARCLLRDCKKLAHVYFNYQKELEKNEQNTTPKTSKGRKTTKVNREPESN